MKENGGRDLGRNPVFDLQKLPVTLQKQAAQVSELVSSPFTRLAEEYGAERVYYGHSHGRERFHDSLHGEVNGIHYQLISGDYLDFDPVKVISLWDASMFTCLQMSRQPDRLEHAETAIRLS
ncbi:MAG: hypothetical protein U0L49_08690 [Eubacterium sp.]|nr:hypothetical protein [Eubacterium sp.]